MRVTKEFSFAASHQIPGHRGKCAQLHGHNYRVAVSVYGPLDDSTGMVVDFEDLKAAVSPLIELLDHKHLNDYIKNPTAENIAGLFGSVLGRIADTVILKCVSIVVHETDTCCAEWNSINDQEVIRHLQGWREPDNISEGLREALAVAKRAATTAVNSIILANRPRVHAITGGSGGGLSQS